MDSEFNIIRKFLRFSPVQNTNLDFLQIPNFFTFDLKDSYLTVAEIIFVIIGCAQKRAWNPVGESPTL